MKIAAINNYGKYQNYAMPQFEGKKEKHTNPIKTTLKAVPLAVLVAMSPLNTVQAQQQQEEKVIETVDITNYFHEPYRNLTGKLFAISTDGNDDDFEKVVIQTKEIERKTFTDDRTGKEIIGKRTTTTNYQLEKLEKTTYVTDLSEDVKKSAEILGIPTGDRVEYSLLGHATIHSTPYLLEDGSSYGEDFYIKLEELPCKITKELYQALSDTMGNGVKYKEYEIKI